MGIGGLFQFMKKRCPDVFQKKPIDSLSGKTLVSDASLFMYKYLSVCTYTGNSIYGRKSFLMFFIQKIAFLKKHNISLVYVFDGQAPKEKDITRDKRRDKRQKAHERLEAFNTTIKKIQNIKDSPKKAKELITDEEFLDAYQRALQKKAKPIESIIDIPKLPELRIEKAKLERQEITFSKSDCTDLKNLLTALGIPYIEAPGEADQMCAHLVNTHKAFACLSEDSDMLTYGCKRLIIKFDYSTKEITLIKYKRVLKNLELSHGEFVDFCILCGSDYNPNIKNIGPGKAYDLIKKYGSIEKICEIIGDEKADEFDRLNHIVVRGLFNLKTSKLPKISLPRLQQDIKKFNELRRDKNLTIDPGTYQDLGFKLKSL